MSHINRDDLTLEKIKRGGLYKMFKNRRYSTQPCLL